MMRELFADTFYWVALINPSDDWYQPVLSFSQSLGQIPIVTTEEVLTEVLAFYAKSNQRMRMRTISFVERILNHADIQVVQQSHTSFCHGFELYRDRPDKGYSLTDCISMNTMRDRGITEALTHDQHFAQEGFVILFRSKDP